MRLPQRLPIGVTLFALLAGVTLGAYLHAQPLHSELQIRVEGFLASVGELYFRGIFLLVLPLIGTALALAVMELHKNRGLLKQALNRTLMYSVLTTLASVLIAVALVRWMPWDQLPHLGGTLESQGQGPEVGGLSPDFSFLSHPVSLLAWLGILVWRARQDRSKESFFGTVYQSSLTTLQGFLLLTPVAIIALISSSILQNGLTLLNQMASYVGVVLVGLLIQQFGVYSLLLRWRTRHSPLEFFRKSKAVYLQAFATSSSSATLPVSLHTAEHELGLSPRIARMVLTVGSSANQNGTALFEGVTLLFLARVYGVDLTVLQQLQIAAISLTAGLASGGVPGGSVPVLVVLLTYFDIPAEGVGLILGTDRFLDMCRTTLNVSGDLVITALVDADLTPLGPSNSNPPTGGLSPSDPAQPLNP